MKTKRVKRLKCLLFILLCMPFTANATKVELMGGYYSLTAKTAVGSGSLSNFGSFYIGYAVPLATQFDMGLAYNLTLSNTFGGDSAFGFDVYLNYFPITRSSILDYNSDTVHWFSQERLRPFVGAGFSQRQFQVVQASSYGGFEIKGGVEYQIKNSYYLKTEIRNLILGGPSKSSVTYRDLILGLSYEF